MSAFKNFPLGVVTHKSTTLDLDIDMSIDK